MHTNKAKAIATAQKSNAIIKERFQKKFIDLLQSGADHQHFVNNIWILNEIVVPLGPNEKITSHFLKPKYATPENDHSLYMGANKLLLSSNHEKMLKIDETHTGSDMNLVSSSSTSLNQNNFSLDISEEHFVNTALVSTAVANSKQNLLVPKNYIHTFYACNKQGLTSPPLIIFQRNDLEANACKHAMAKSVCIEENSNGELNELGAFVKWLNLFMQKQALELKRQNRLNGSSSTGLGNTNRLIQMLSMLITLNRKFNSKIEVFYI